MPDPGDQQPITKAPPRWRKWAVIGIAAAVAAAVIVPTAMVLLAWSRIERVQIDTVGAREALAGSTTSIAPNGTGGSSDGIDGETGTTTLPDFTPGVPTTLPSETTEGYPPPPDVPASPAVADSVHQAILIIGSDRTIGGTRRADVIMLALLPADGSNPMLVSLPRDLYLDDPCDGGRERINAALNGCGSVSGPNLLTVVVEDFTGIPVDHFVLFDYDGFARVIDIAGGIDVCVDHYTYDTNTTPDLELDAGCSTLDGKMALAWVRSRKTRQIVDGVDQVAPGASDSGRNARQRDVVLQMVRKLSGFNSPSEIVSLANAAPGAFILDSGFSLSNAVGIAWDLRGKASSIRSPRIAVEQYTTEGGAWVLVPTESFADAIG
ncbi:MAG: LCP family protein [Actinobacteria bacterium]|nr:LCP family protein [Actinomycetota bacterium]